MGPRRSMPMLSRCGRVLLGGALLVLASACGSADEATTATSSTSEVATTAAPTGTTGATSTSTSTTSTTASTVAPTSSTVLTTARAVTGDDVRTRVAPSTLVAEGARRLGRGDVVAVVCQANDLGLGGGVDAGSAVWFLLDDGLWVIDAYVEHEPVGPGSPPGGYFDPTLPVCDAAQVPVDAPTTTIPLPAAIDCGVIALQGGEGPRVTVEADVGCDFAVQLMDGIVRGSSLPDDDGTYRLGQWTCSPAGGGVVCTSASGRITAI